MGLHTEAEQPGIAVKRFALSDTINRASCSGLRTGS